jgi:flagellar biosynthesis anti-sigma factor FlgM
MKIEHNKISQLNRLISETIDKKRFQNTQGYQNIKGELDGTSISKEGQFLAKVMQKLQSSPDIRADKIEEIRQQIVDGTYEYNFEELARKISDLLEWE